MEPVVSVIMTVYNKPRWLAESIESVIAQTFEDWELIIMEDNSPDRKVKKIIESYDDSRFIKYYSNVSEVERYNTARYATLINIAGFNIARGKYFTYLTDDDFYYPNRLEVMVEYLQAHPDMAVVYGSLQNVDADGGHAGVREAKEVLYTAFDKVDHNAVMHTREAFYAANGWYDVPGVWGGADAYFWRRLNEAGYPFYPIEDIIAAKRYHEDSVQWKISKGLWPPSV